MTPGVPACGFITGEMYFCDECDHTSHPLPGGPACMATVHDCPRWKMFVRLKEDEHAALRYLICREPAKFRGELAMSIADCISDKYDQLWTSDREAGFMAAAHAGRGVTA